MRHRKAGRLFQRTSAHRKAMFANMVTSLFEHERIQTTDAKAKELRIHAEKLITVAKNGAAAASEAEGAADGNARQRLTARSVHLRRRAARIVRDREVLSKLFEELAGRYADRAGGYTRITKLGNRVGDAAPISLIELVDSPFAVGAAAADTEGDADEAESKETPAE